MGDRASAGDGTSRGAECPGLLEMDAVVGPRAGHDAVHLRVWLMVRRFSRASARVQLDWICIRRRPDDLGICPPSPAARPEIKICEQRYAAVWMRRISFP